MPGLVVFNRRWGIASDDFVFPGLFELFIRVLWYVNECHHIHLGHPPEHKTNHHLCYFIYFRWIGAMILFTYHKGNFDCNGSAVLHTYLVGLLVVLGLIILSICAIVYVSAQGKCVCVCVYLNTIPEKEKPIAMHDSKVCVVTATFFKNYYYYYFFICFYRYHYKHRPAPLHPSLSILASCPLHP